MLLNRIAEPFEHTQNELRGIYTVIKADIKLIRHDNRPGRYDVIILNDLVRVKKRLEMIIG